MTTARIPMHRRRLAAGLVGLAVLVGSAVSQQSFAQTLIDYDTDDDNLIEVDNLAKLNAIRYDLDGNGAPTPGNMSDYAAAFPNPATPMCNTTCRGYELTEDLNFDTNDDKQITAADDGLSWGEGADAGKGWQPIGTLFLVFEAVFNGNGRTISYLFIDDDNNSNVGLFGVAARSDIRNVGLVEVNVTGNTAVGSLVGFHGIAGEIRASYATGGVNGMNFVGGLVASHGGTMDASSATVVVTGGDNAGGLVSFNEGTIRASYATGEVSGGDNVGGLVANDKEGTIRASYATGEVSGGSNVGGLVGEHEAGTIRASYATGVVSGDSNVGGLVGVRGVLNAGVGTVDASYATGEVRGGNNAGGLVGELFAGTIRASYATGEVSGDAGVGGLVGELFAGTIRASYATGRVSGNSDVGGLVGSHSDGTIDDSYFDTNTSGLMGSEGKTTVALQVPTAYDGIYANWNLDLDSVAGGDDPWDFGSSVQYPLLQVDFNGDGDASWEEFGQQPRLESPGVFVSPRGLSLVEGDVGTYTIVLLTAPTARVTVTPSSDDSAEVRVFGGALTFMPDNWNMEQTVTVLAVEDASSDDETVLLRHAVDSADGNYGAVTAHDVTVTVTNTNDYDQDGDGLIEVRSLAQLDAIRYDLNGDGVVHPVTVTATANYTAVFPDPAMSMGCPSTCTSCPGICTGYELMTNLDFDTSGDGEITSDDVDLSWGGGRGWQSIGTEKNANHFAAEFDGNDHTISHLFIDNTSGRGILSGGLFGSAGPNAAIRSVGIVGMNIMGTDTVGGLVGNISGGTIDACYAIGEVNGMDFVGGLVGNNDGGTIRTSYAIAEVSGNSQVGGLAGQNDLRGLIDASYATGMVSGNGNIGGLVGNNNRGIIRASYATGVVSGGVAIDPENVHVGGLVGNNFGGTIDASYATGMVSGNNEIGGLVGENDSGAIDASYATGMVSGQELIGGLAGFNDRGAIHASYATGAVEGAAQVGGLAGNNNQGTIDASYATGRVSGSEIDASDLNSVGGLVGGNSGGAIRASYATGVVSGNIDVGGLAGRNRPVSVSNGTISASYAIGEVSGSGNVGGLVGSNTGILHDSYFNTDTFSSTNTEGRTAAQLRMPTTYSGIYADWNLDLDNEDEDSDLTTGRDDPWDFGTPQEYPLLQVDFDGDGVKSWEEFGPQSRPGIFVSVRTLSLMEGTTGAYTVVLLTTPTAPVTVTPGLDDNTAAVSVSGELTFMMGNWDTAQTVMVGAAYDMNTANEVVSLTHSVASASTGNYASVIAPDVLVTVMDNGAGIAVSPGELSLMEGSTGAYTVVLLSMPTAEVRIMPMSANPAAVSVSGGELTFMPENWNTTQAVTVRAVDGANAVGQVVVLSHTVASGDPNYNSVTPPEVTVTVTDRNAGISVSTRSLSLIEGGRPGSYTIVLLSMPTTDVRIMPMSASPTAVSVSSELAFTTGNWGMEQTVTVRAVPDANTASEVVLLMHSVESDDRSYALLTVPDVEVRVTDTGIAVTGNGEGNGEGIRVRVRVFLEGPLR